MSEPQNLDPGRSGYIEITPDILAQDFMAEVRELAIAAAAPGFEQRLERFGDYAAYLRTVKRSSAPLKNILDASGGTRIVDASTQSAAVWDAFHTAHLAACCELFHGSRLLKQQFSAEQLNAMAQKFLEPYRSAGKADIQRIAGKLHTMDTVRVMQLLRALGLITRKTSGFQQLALGAGAGQKDMYALHKVPDINRSESFDGVGYSFSCVQEYVGHIVITDLDETRQSLYEQYNQQSSPPALAVCADTMSLLQDLPGFGVKKRNLVTAIRIDHRMLPDVEGFLGALSKSLDDQCALIMSMGAGNTVEEFEGRVNKLAEVFDVLDELGHQPVLLKMHGPGTLPEQHASLRFGNPSSSTFQVLFCQLRRKALQKLIKKG